MNKKMTYGGILVVILMLLVTFSSAHAATLSITKSKHNEIAYAEHDITDPILDPRFTYHVSGCLMEGCTDCEDVEFIIEGNDLTYYHYSEWTYNCCATMIVLLETEDHLIRFIELEHIGEDGPCYCLCDYELTGTVYGLPAGDYTVEVWSYFWDGENPTLYCQTTITI